MEQYYKSKYKNQEIIVSYGETLKNINHVKTLIPLNNNKGNENLKTFCPIFFSTINLDHLLTIIHLILMENSIVFISKNLNLLTSAMFYNIVFPLIL